MKKIICLISLLIAEFVFADVISERYNDEMIHLGLPGWVSLSDTNTLVSNEVPFVADDHVNLYRSTIYFPDSFYIDVYGERYHALTVYKNGIIGFGTGEKGYEKDPHVRTRGASITTSIGDSFEWGIHIQKIDDEETKFVVVNFGPFEIEEKYSTKKRKFSIQALLFQDGEVQVQYWKHDSLNDAASACKYDDWMHAEYYDGHRTLTSSGEISQSSVYLYGKEGLRPGWIAKALRPEYDVEITEPKKGDGLLVKMRTMNRDLGGIIAHDYSREYPVVGGISAIEVKTSGLPSSYFSPLYCWFFDEYYPTYSANYPFYLSNENTNLVIMKDLYSKTWNGYRTNPDQSPIFLRADEIIDFIGAPAFKFQRTSTGNDYAFYIKEIKYNLAQPQSIQFLRIQSKRNLVVNGSLGGVVEFIGIHGKKSKDNSYSKTYELYKGQAINGSITTSPGYEIESVIMKTIGNTEQDVVIYQNDTLRSTSAFRFDFSVEKEKRKIQIKGEMIYPTHLAIFVTYKKCTDRNLPMITPYMVKTETHTAPQNYSNDKVFSSAVILNAFGGVAQKQEKIKNNKYSVSSAYSNDLNQTTRVPMVFAHVSSTKDFEYVDMACEGCIVDANAYYYRRSEDLSLSGTDEDIDRPDAKDNAFTEMEYFNPALQNGAISAAAGIAERSRALKDSVYAKAWEMVANSEEDFIPSDSLDDASLIEIYSMRSKRGGNNFVLKVDRDAEGRFSQKIYNNKGQLVSSWFFNGTKEVVVLYKYDSFGNLLKQYYKNHSEMASSTEYDAQGRVVSVESNDKGKIEYRYNSFGGLRFIRKSVHLAEGDGRFTANVYDTYGRLTAVGEVYNMPKNAFDSVDAVIPKGNIRYTSKILYGKPRPEDLTSLGVNSALGKSILDRMTGIRTNDVGAVISFDDSGKFVTIKLSDYNRIGQKTNQWIIFGLPNAPAIQLNYAYNASGLLETSSFDEWNGSEWIEKSNRQRSYDEKLRLTRIGENGKALAKYSYTEMGNIKEKEYCDSGKTVIKEKITLDVYGRPTDISYVDSAGKEIYSTDLQFKSVESQKITNASHNWDGTFGNVAKNNEYEYDYSGRITSVAGGVSGSYEYDAIGRMKHKMEGDTSINYIYHAQTYRPSSFDINGRYSAGASFLEYDESGNVWLDAHNLVAYKNNINGQPVKVSKFASVPQNVTLDVVRTTVGEIPGAESSVDIAYDENGDRVWYSYSGTGQDRGFTEITVPGVGVYRADRVDGADGEFRLVRMDLVAGGYRDAGGSVHFPVKDAQGNVRGYASSAGLESAYDYYPYGTAVELSANGADDRRRWQGKEFDGEHGKYYFGARYFDPFFALWASPDPAGQFANPYSYGGDPVNGTDYNGLWFGIDDAISAGVGALIGLASYSIMNYDDWHLDRALAYTGIGAASGWLTWNTGGANLALASQGVGGLSANMSFWGAVGYGALSAGIGSGFSAGATYVEKNAYGEDGYSIDNLLENWDGGDFATAMLAGAATGAIIGGSISGSMWGVSRWSNIKSEEFYSIPDEELSESDKFVKDNKLRRSPVDKGWKSAGMKRDNPVAEAALRGDVDRGNPYANAIAKRGFCREASVCQRFEGGLHLEVSNTTGSAVGHYDFFDPAKSPFHLIGHGLEVSMGKNIFGSSVSWVEPSLIAPLINGLFYDWEKTEWFW